MSDLSDTDPTITLSLSSQIESLLFIATEPVSLSRLAKTLEVTTRRVEKTLANIQIEYEDRGLRLQWLDGGVQLTTAPEASGAIERFLGLEVSVTRLSQAALEVLAIVAYQQPVTRPQVDELRGVNSDGALRTLLSKGLLEEVGRLDGPGRPILYGTTAEFMQHFGLGHLTDMPLLPDDETAVEDDRSQDETE